MTRWKLTKTWTNLTCESLVSNAAVVLSTPALFFREGCSLLMLYCSTLLERLLDSLRANDAEFEESDDEEDVEKLRVATKRPRLDEEETAPKAAAEASVAEPPRPTPSSAVSLNGAQAGHSANGATAAPAVAAEQT